MAYDLLIKGGIDPSQALKAVRDVDLSGNKITACDSYLGSVWHA